jgi:hypothetical protein
MLFSVYFAYKKEKTDQINSYSKAIPSDKDTKSNIIKKIETCLKAPTHTIKWRRSFLAAVISTLMIFSIVHFRIPDVKELLLYILIIYVVYYSMWDNYTKIYCQELYKIGKLNLKKLRYDI